MLADTCMNGHTPPLLRPIVGVQSPSTCGRSPVNSETDICLWDFSSLSRLSNSRVAGDGRGEGDQSARSTAGYSGESAKAVGV